MIHASQPGVVSAWVTGWPRQLWSVGASDPALSAFLLRVLLALAKRAAEKGSVHSGLFLEACPLMVPFLHGIPGAQHAQNGPPPLAMLPAERDGPQCLAATFLQHFPKLVE